jgi:hypothetical protein
MKGVAKMSGDLYFFIELGSLMVFIISIGALILVIILYFTRDQVNNIIILLF